MAEEGGFKIDVERIRRSTPDPALERLQQIEQLKGYHRYFHLGVPNNFVFLLVSLAYPLEEYLTDMAEYTSPLNQANTRVYQYCLQKLKELPKETVLSHDRLIQLMGGWERTITTSANLGGVGFSEKVFGILAELGIDARGRWPAEVPEMRDVFIRVPARVERLLRINLTIPQDFIVSTFHELMGEILRSPEALTLIERIEIAKPHIGDSSTAPSYPTIIFYLSADANREERFEAVDRFLRLLQPLFIDFEHGLVSDREFADPWHSFVTLTQGHKLWKKYLRVMGLLDEVYDRDVNYAYCRSECDEEPRNFPRILNAYRRA